MKRNQTNKHLLKFLQESSPVEAAKGLLGCVLQTTRRGVTTSGIIIETEAYDGRCDEACHAFRGMTKRTATMFGPPGHAYVYLIYGMHYCVNVVVDQPGVGSAVLIRALEPLDGLGTMRRRRKTENPRALCSGPAKLCDALKISRELNGVFLFDAASPVLLSGEPAAEKSPIVQTTRIGITKAADLPWRFYLADKLPWVSLR